jgi:hypothetical protein
VSQGHTTGGRAIKIQPSGGERASDGKGAASLIVSLIGLIVGGFLARATDTRAVQPAPAEQQKKSALRDPLVWATAAIAAATVATAVVGYLQKLTLDKTDQTLRLQQRAWLAPRGIDPTPRNFVDRVDAYTEIFLPFENVGKEPATKLNEQIAATIIRYDDFRNETAMRATIKAALDGRPCDNFSLNQEGRAVYPGGKVGIWVGLEADKVAKVNKRDHFALIAGCLIYQTLKERHQSKVCMILEPYGQPEKWRSTGCTVHNDAD